jgi:mono/diheme cytochrome c family protein
MKKINSQLLLESLLWVINPCLLLLSIFSNTLHIGTWLSWLGQWHPVILHFPIVLGLCIGLYILVNYKPILQEPVEQKLFTLHAIFASCVALLGIFISKVGNYDKNILLIHQWGGLAIAYVAWLVVLVPKSYFISRPLFRKLFSIGYVLVIVIFTHKGGQLTHGKDALSLPKNVQQETAINKPDSLLTIYEKAVQPILMDKCVTCHGGDKIKGDLQLTSIELIKKGGKHGNQLLERIHLAMTDEKHMPPVDNKQLTKEELAIITKWMQLGGDLNKAMKAFDKKDSLFLLASRYTPPSFNKATEQPSLEEYNSNYVTVRYDFYGSDKINVNFFQGTFYKTEYLEKLSKIKDQIITLNMQNIPLQKKDMDIITGFTNLEKLNLNYTKLKMEDIQGLATMKKLKSLSLAGMIVDNNKLEPLIKTGSLQKLQLWATGLFKKDLNSLITKYPSIVFTVGDNLEDSIMKLNKPTIQQDSSIITDNLIVPIKHFLNGVTIKYTIDDAEPDSINSPTYTTPLKLNKNTTVKTKVFKKGWISSEVVQKTFYKSSLSADTIILLTQPDPKYIGIGGNTIIDHALGEMNFGNGKWLGYSKTNMEFVMQFKTATQMNEVIFNSLINTGSYIFPIQSIQVEGSMDGKSFKPLQSQDFTAISNAYTKETNINQVQSFKVKIDKVAAYPFYKFTLRNLKQLPNWHPGKGTPAWIFVDEVFFN